jgi:hypothetical protein
MTAVLPMTAVRPTTEALRMTAVLPMTAVRPTTEALRMTAARPTTEALPMTEVVPTIPASLGLHRGAPRRPALRRR